MAHKTAIELQVERIRDCVLCDLSNPAFRAAAAGIASADRAYARAVVATDPEVSWAMDEFGDKRDEAALSLLSSKLLIFAERTGTMPIVGRDSAWAILAAKLRLQVEAPPVSLAPSALAVPSQQLACSMLAAGLSLAFLDGTALEGVPFKELARFKEKHNPLLERHQISLLDAAHEFVNLPDNAEMQARIAKLRTEAQHQRIAMEDEAREAWLSEGLALGKKAVVAAAAGVLPLVALLRSASLSSLLAAALPGTALAITAVASAIKKTRHSHVRPAAYLFQAGAFVDRNWTNAGARVD